VMESKGEFFNSVISRLQLKENLSREESGKAMETIALGERDPAEVRKLLYMLNYNWDTHIVSCIDVADFFVPGFIKGEGRDCRGSDRSCRYYVEICRKGED
jgi:hypothetical protein